MTTLWTCETCGHRVGLYPGIQPSKLGHSRVYRPDEPLPDPAAVEMHDGPWVPAGEPTQENLFGR